MYYNTMSGVIFANLNYEFNSFFGKYKKIMETIGSKQEQVTQNGEKTIINIKYKINYDIKKMLMKIKPLIYEYMPYVESEEMENIISKIEKLEEYKNPK